MPNWRVTYHVIAMDRNAMQQAHEAVTRAGRTWETLGAEIAALPHVTLEADGVKGMSQRRAVLEHYQELKAAATMEAIEAIQAAEERFNAKVDAQVQLSGEHMTAGEADIALLTGPLVESAEQLEQIMSTGDLMANPCVRRAANICARRLESEIIFGDRGDQVKGYGKEFFDICRRAARNPNDGYASMMLAVPNMQSDLARSFGVSAEYEKGAPQA